MAVLQCDEHINRAIPSGLRVRGREAYTIEEAGLKGQPDNNIFAFCQARKRILLTNDSDFLKMAAGRHHTGVIFVTSVHVPLGEIIRSIILLLDGIPENSFRNGIFYVP